MSMIHRLRYTHYNCECQDTLFNTWQLCIHSLENRLSHGMWAKSHMPSSFTFQSCVQHVDIVLSKGRVCTSSDCRHCWSNIRKSWHEQFVDEAFWFSEVAQLKDRNYLIDTQELSWLVPKHFIYWGKKNVLLDDSGKKAWGMKGPKVCSLFDNQPSHATKAPIAFQNMRFSPILNPTIMMGFITSWFSPLPPLTDSPTIFFASDMLYSLWRVVEFWFFFLAFAIKKIVLNN